MADQTTLATPGTAPGTAPTDQAAPAGATNLQLSDLYVAIQAITLASNRGAYRPEEFVQIGTVYERIFTFLKESGAIAPGPTQDDTASAPAQAAA